MSEILETLGTRLRPFADVFVAVAQRDASVTQQQQVLVAASVFLLVLLVVVILLLATTPPKKRVVRRRRVIVAEPPRSVESRESSQGAEVPDAEPEGESEIHTAEPPRHERLASILLGTPAIIAVAFALLAATYGVSGTNAFCTYQCHDDTAAAPEVIDFVPLTATPIATRVVETETVEPGYHQRCASCHRLDVVSNVADRTRMVTRALLGSDSYGDSAVVSSVTCLRCHGSVLDETVVGRYSNVRMSHAEPVAAGMTCVGCHDRIGHPGYRSPQMTECIECHDDISQPTACDTCHLANPSDRTTRDMPQATASRRVYTQVELRSDRCYDCHRTESCDACHGLRLPHPPEFVAERHARDAAWDRKSLCYRCHDVPFCNRCHLGFAASHSEGFEAEHTRLTPEANCSCHDRRRPERTEPFCTVCHW